MAKSNVNKVWDELKKLSPSELIEAILSYEDQNALNYDAEGKKRKYPIGMIAKNIKEYNTEMTDRLFYGMSRDFAKVIAG